MTGTKITIMTMVVTKTMIMTMAVTKTITNIFRQVQQFLLFAQNDKKGYENSICTSSLKNRCFLHYSAY